MISNIDIPNNKVSINENKINFAFFGSSRVSIVVLDELKKNNLIPTLIIAGPDKPKGRGQEMSQNMVKEWAIINNIPVESPFKFDTALAAILKALKCDFFLVASYGKIIPRDIINIPTKGSLNIHPSLLPQYRGPSPILTAILDDTKQTGVSIIKMDEEMDHGPVLATKKVRVDEWPTYEKFEEMMATEGSRLFIEILPDWLAGNIKETIQDHSQATFTRKVTKEDGLIDLKGDPYTNFRKIQAYHEWPQAYFFMEHRGRQIRVKITEAVFENNSLVIKKVIPEGGKEIAFEDFKRGYNFA